MAPERISLARRKILTDALGVALASSIYAMAFGATARSSGASVAQACSLSLLMFTGASQSALVSVLGTGGTIAAALSVAWLLGARNGLYAIRLSPLLPRGRLRRAAAAHFSLDETMALSVVRETPDLARYAFWATSLTLFVFWNAATLIGALAGGLIDDPGKLGLDVAFPAAFLALVWPHLSSRPALRTAALAGLISMASIPLAPKGVPVLLCVLATVGAIRSRRDAPSTPPTLESAVAGGAR